MMFDIEQKEFLKKYRPQNDHFTSEEEISKVANILDITVSTPIRILNEIRDEVVKFYSESQVCEMNHMKESEISNTTGRCWDYIVAMQSVVTIIDHYKFVYRNDLAI